MKRSFADAQDDRGDAQDDRGDAQDDRGDAQDDSRATTDVMLSKAKHL